MESERKSIFRPDPSPLRLTFIVFSGSSIMCVASAIDPLRAANRIAGETKFDFKLVSANGAPPITTAGIPIAVSGRFDANDDTDVIITLGGFGTRFEASKTLFNDLRRASRRAQAYGGIEAGTWVLGHAGLLEGRAATTHWEDLEDFATRFPGCDVRPDRYVIDGPLFSAGGASPTFDLMLHLIRSRLGISLALDVASVFIYDRPRAPSDAQPLVSLGQLVGHDPRLAKAIRLMETHIDQPLTIAAIALRTGVTARTLEKLFTADVGESPGAYYLRLRLFAARRLVLDTTEAMADIASRTGFSGAASFSRAFRIAFGMAPSQMRKGANVRPTSSRTS